MSQSRYVNESEEMLWEEIVANSASYLPFEGPPSGVTVFLDRALSLSIPLSPWLLFI